jgi:hypothetical protein
MALAAAEINQRRHSLVSSLLLQALALGADGVGVGKPYLYGLAAGGAPGVSRAMNILR